MTTISSSTPKTGGTLNHQQSVAETTTPTTAVPTMTPEGLEFFLLFPPIATTFYRAAWNADAV